MNGLQEKSYSDLKRLIHDLAQPLTAIKAYLGGCELRLQKNELSSAQMMGAVQKIAEYTELSEKKIALIRQILIQESDAQFSNLIAEIVSLFSFEIKWFEIQLTLDIQENNSDFLMDRLLFKQVLVHLLKQCIDVVEKNSIQKAQLSIQIKMHEQEGLILKIKRNFLIDQAGLEKEHLYFESILSRQPRTLSHEVCERESIILFTMFHQDCHHVI